MKARWGFRHSQVRSISAKLELEYARSERLETLVQNERSCGGRDQRGERVELGAQITQVETDPSSPQAIAPEQTRAHALATDAASHSAARLGVVNGLRGCAILAVIYHHLVVPFVAPDGASGQVFDAIGSYYVSFTTLLTNSWMGVNLFFVLSGFVLTLPYELGHRALGSKADVLDFFARRAKRLLPLYYFCIALTLFAESRSHWVAAGPPGYVLRVLTFTFIFYEPHFITFFDVPLWSLAVEVVFSILFPFLLFGFRRIGVRWITLAVFIVALLVRCYATSVRLGPPTSLEFLKDSPFARLDDFVLGMAVCHVYIKGRKLAPWAALTCLLVGFALVFVSAVGWDNVELKALSYGTAAYLHIFTNVGFGAILLGFLNAPSIVRRLMTLPPLQLCGMMCYSLYIWHMYGINLAGPQWPASHTAYAIFLVFVFSAMTYRYIEFPRTPLRKLFVEFAN